MYDAEQGAWPKDFLWLNAFTDIPRPVCSSDGYYAPVQYLHGMAYCADQHGNRIEEYELPIHEAENMTCSRFSFIKVKLLAKIMVQRSKTLQCKSLAITFKIIIAKLYF